MVDVRSLLEKCKMHDYLSICYVDGKLQVNGYGCGCCAYGTDVESGDEVNTIDCAIENFREALEKLYLVRAHYESLNAPKEGA